MKDKVIVTDSSNILSSTRVLIPFIIFLSVASIVLAENEDNPIKTDDMQSYYLQRHREINLELLSIHDYLKMETIHLQELNELASLEKLRNGFVSSTSQDEIRIVELRIHAAQNKINAKEKDKTDLKLEADKYYKGRLPKSFNEQWSRDEEGFLNAVK